MTTRIIQSLDSLTILTRSLPEFAHTLSTTITDVTSIYQELCAIYQERADAALREYDKAMESISGLLDCSHSESCECVSEYQSRASEYQRRYQEVIDKLDAIMDPVKQRMDTTPMFDSYKIIDIEHERYAAGLRNLIHVAEAYLQA